MRAQSVSCVSVSLERNACDMVFDCFMKERFLRIFALTFIMM